MKKILIIAGIFCFFSHSLYAKEIKLSTSIFKVDTLPTIQLITFIQQMELDSYYGKPVDSFLLAIPANLYNLKVYGSSHSQGALFRASEMVVDFTPDGHGPGAIIYVRGYTHMNRYSPSATWDVNLFRQENIYKIEIYKDQNTRIIGTAQ
jgi:hypothetical protein